MPVKLLLSVGARVGSGDRGEVGGSVFTVGNKLSVAVKDKIKMNKTNYIIHHYLTFDSSTVGHQVSVSVKVGIIVSVGTKVGSALETKQS